MVEATSLLSTEECSGKLVRVLRRSSVGHGHTGEKKIIFLLTARIGRLPTRSLGYIACVLNRLPPVFTPQTGTGTERPCSESACGVL